MLLTKNITREMEDKMKISEILLGPEISADRVCMAGQGQVRPSTPALTVLISRIRNLSKL